MRFLPVAGVGRSQLSDTFGAERDGGARSHRGIDIFADEGTPVVAVRGGIVVKAGDAGKGGVRAWVKDDQGFFHYYAHMNALNVRQGQRVEAGQRIGGVGRTGNAAGTPAHLHYSVNHGGGTSEAGAINPYNFLMGNRSDGGLHVSPLTAEQPEQRAVERTSGEVMAGVMQSISRAASAQGGRVLDVNALLGRPADDIPEPDIEVA